MPSKLISIGELIDQSWEHYRAAWPTFLGISGWAAVLILLNIVSLIFYPDTQTIISEIPLTGSEMFGFILYAGTNYVIAPLLGFWIFIALVHAAWNRFHQKTPTANTAMRESLKHYLPSILTTALVGLLMLLAILIGFGPYLVTTLLAQWIQTVPLAIISLVLLALGSLVGMILIVRWTVEYYFAPYFPITNAAHGVPALHESRRLVFPHFWAVLWRILIPKFVFILFGVILFLVLYYVTDLFVNAAAGLNIMVYARLNSILLAILPIVVTSVLNPLFVLADVLLFRDLQTS